MINRESIYNVLFNAFKEQEYVQALFISGSAAFGRLDEFSDIDVRVLAESQYDDAILHIAEDAFKSISIIQDSHTVPPANLRGYVQSFYKLQGLTPFQVIDFVILRDEHLKEVLDIKRAGIPVILIDRFSKLSMHETPQEMLAGFQERLPDLIKQFGFLSRLLVERAIRRGRFAEAVYFYHARILNPLLEILRAKYSPERQDYSARYLQWDLPPEIVRTLDELYSVSSFERLKENLDRAEILFFKTVKSLNL